MPSDKVKGNTLFSVTDNPQNTELEGIGEVLTFGTFVSKYIVRKSISHGAKEIIYQGYDPGCLEGQLPPKNSGFCQATINDKFHTCVNYSVSDII